MKNLKDIQSILSKVKYKDAKFTIAESDGGFLLTVENLEPKYGNLHPLIHDLKWYLSKWSTDTEIVRSAYKAVMDIEMQAVKRFSKECTEKITRLLFKIGTDDRKYDNEEVCQRICRAFHYKNWSLRAQKRDNGFLFQIVFLEKDNADPTKTEMQYCRKWFVDNDYIEHTYYPGIIHAIEEAIEAAETHEMNENYLYEGVTIYNPHMNLDGLVDFIKKTPFDMRSVPTT
jgi:hypothetical protein